MSDARASARRALQRTAPWYWSALGLRRRARRAALIARVTAIAALRHATVELEIAPDVALGRGVRIEIEPNTTNRLTMGAGTRIHDGVTIWLRGGTVELGRQVIIRRGVEMNSSGLLRLEEEALLSFRMVVHCAESVTIGARTIVGEHTTITDSFHVRTPPGERILHHVRTKPTHVGRDVWIAAQAIIAAGVTVGDGAFIAGSAVVTRDVAPGWLVAGNPAQPVRELEYGARGDGGEGGDDDE
jgi:acetyltransferase-like isoleucine patch superfamily enzyme